MKKPQGFATFSKEKLKEAASRGGLSTASESRTYSKDRQLAREAGIKGGKASAAARKAKKDAG